MKNPYLILIFIGTLFLSIILSFSASSKQYANAVPQKLFVYPSFIFLYIVSKSASTAAIAVSNYSIVSFGIFPKHFLSLFILESGNY